MDSLWLTNLPVWPLINMVIGKQRYQEKAPYHSAGSASAAESLTVLGVCGEANIAVSFAVSCRLPGNPV